MPVIYIERERERRFPSTGSFSQMSTTAGAGQAKTESQELSTGPLHYKGGRDPTLKSSPLGSPALISKKLDLELEPRT